MSRRDDDDRDERACDALGDLLSSLPTPPAPLPDARLAARLERALAEAARGGRARDGRPRRWLRVAPALAGGLVVAAAITFWMTRVRPLTYELAGDVADRAGHVAAASGGPASIRFSDGSEIALAPSAAGWIAARTRVGATFALEHGKASFAVAHRPGARWLVQAGPFQIVVTGTRFDVRWSGERGDMQLDLREGGVTVRGGVAGDGVSLRAGQRLVASASRGLLTVEQIHPEAHAGARAEHDDGGRPQDPGDPTHHEPSSPKRTTPARLASLDHRPKGRPAATEAEVQAPPPEPAPAEEPRPGPSEDPLFLAPERIRLRGAGGNFCETFIPQFRFERSTEGFEVPPRYVTALRNRALDREHSWCGAGSLRLEADFNLAGPANQFGSLPNQVGQVTVQLGKPVDLTDKLVVVHFFLDAPTGTQFGVQVMAISKGRWVGGGFEGNVEAGHWWTISHVFQEQNPLKGGGSPVAEVDALAFQIYATGAQRRWRGNVYIDDVGWR